jgi:hypothetical protein
MSETFDATPNAMIDETLGDWADFLADRGPTPEADGTATWSPNTLCKALCRAADGLPEVSTDTIWRTLREAGRTHQRTRTWWPAGTAARRRKAGAVGGPPVWCCDEAGPFQTVPQPGASSVPEGNPARQPHESVRNGTAEVLTPFHPATGRVEVEGATSTTNAVLRA